MKASLQAAADIEMGMKDGARVDLMLMGTPTSSLRTVASSEGKEHGTLIRGNSSLNDTQESYRSMETASQQPQGIFHGTSAKLPGKVAGIHWYHQTCSHAAELTASTITHDTEIGTLQWLGC